MIKDLLLIKSCFISKLQEVKTKDEIACSTVLIYLRKEKNFLIFQLKYIVIAL